MISRRHIFGRLLGEVLAAADECKGVRHLQLDNVFGLPDERLGMIVPQVRNDVEIIVVGDLVKARCRRRADPITLFTSEPAGLFVFNRFNGEVSLSQVGAEIAVAMSWTNAQGFAYVRSLFLKMVELRVCVPSNPVEQS